jgi:hypothetical protein
LFDIDEVLVLLVGTSVEKVGGCGMSDATVLVWGGDGAATGQ